MHKRLTGMGQKKYEKPFHEFAMHPYTLNYPLTLKKPTTIFVNSMSDLFHKNCTFDFIEQVFETMMIGNWHIYQILTKRAERMAEFISIWLKKKNLLEVPKHIWLGVSCGIQKAVKRIEILKTIPAKIKFVSVEPLLELVSAAFDGIHWVIVGGESGVGFRPVKKEWIIEIQKSCEKSGTCFYFKQWGGRTSKSGGRTLDGKIYDEMPVIAA